MASTEYLEEARRTDVDESTVNTVVDPAGAHIVSTPNISQSQQQQHQQHQQFSENSYPNRNSSIIVSNGDTHIAAAPHKHHQSFNGDLQVNHSVVNNNNNNSIQHGVTDSDTEQTVRLTNNQLLRTNSNQSLNVHNFGVNTSETIGGNNLTVLSSSSLSNRTLNVPPVHTTSAAIAAATITSSGANNQFVAHGNVRGIVNSSHAANSINRAPVNPVIVSSGQQQYHHQQQQQQQHHHQQQHQQHQQHQQQVHRYTTIATGPTAAPSPVYSHPTTIVHQVPQRAPPPPNMSKNNEPVKIVYPSSVGSQPAIINMNNRVTITSQPMQNGISLQQQQGNIITTNATMGGQTTMSQPQPQIVIKNQGTNQNIVGNTMMAPGVQMVMRPGTPTAQGHPKTVATVPPRVVISNQHMVGARPANSGITLSSVQSNQPGSALLVKTENGQFRLLHVGPAANQPAQPQHANQTIRIQTVPSIQNASSVQSSIVMNTGTYTQPIYTTTSSIGQATPVATVAPVPSLAQHAPQPQPQQIQNTSQPTVVVTSSATPAQQATMHNTKEKCRKFLANLLELSSREPKPVAQNVCTLIQELIDATVEPDEFCCRLERLLNASPQPCLIGFLKKSLPLLRQSLYTKELTIEGIKPPPHSVAFGQIGANIPAQVRQMGPTIATVGSHGQVRMMGPRPTTITRHPAPVQSIRMGMPPNAGPRVTNVSQIRAGGTTIVQQGNVQMQTNPPALHPVSQTFAPGGAQIRPTGATIARPMGGNVQIRQNTPMTLKKTVVNHGPNVVVSSLPPTVVTTIKVGSTQIKPVTVNASPITPVVINSGGAPNMMSMPAPMPVQHPVASLQPPAAPAPLPVTPAPATPTSSKPAKEKSLASAQAAAAKAAAASKEKERKASSSFYQQSSMSSSMYGDDDINDVAAMGGVNLAEESQRILGSTEMIGTQIRSCKDEVFLHMPALQARIRNIMMRHGLEEPSNEVAVLVSHACQERLKNIVEKLAVIAEHRIDIIKIDPRYEVTKDVRGQIKFLEELDKAEQKRHEEQEREMLMRAAKSRSKTEDPEQAKLKAKAKEMQRAEMEELRQRDANLTALQAIGPRKKPKLDTDATGSTAAGGTTTGLTGTTATPLRPRIKRVNLRDMIFFMEQERDSCRSPMLYKSYLK